MSKYVLLLTFNVGMIFLTTFTLETINCLVCKNYDLKERGGVIRKKIYCLQQLCLRVKKLVLPWSDYFPEYSNDKL